MSSASLPKEPVTISNTKTIHEAEKATTRWDWITSMIGTVLGALLSLLLSAASISDSFSSLINSIRIRRTSVLFLAGVVGFQFVLFFVLWLVRKKNGEVIKLREQLIGVYLSALNRSRLNPNLESNG